MRLRAMAAAAAALAILSGAAGAAGDPVRGKALHEDCLDCHGTSIYLPPKAKVKTLSELKKAVDEWNDRYNPKFTRQEVEDLVAYLNRDFYKLTR